MIIQCLLYVWAVACVECWRRKGGKRQSLLLISWDFEFRKGRDGNKTGRYVRMHINVDPDRFDKCRGRKATKARELTMVAGES